MNKTSAHAVSVSLFALLAPLVGCGAAPDGEPEPASGTASESLVFGASVVAGTAEQESETAMNINEAFALPPVRTVAYNGGDSAFITISGNNRVVRRGASLMSYAVTTGFGWALNKVRPPTGTAILWGDPGLGQSAGTGYVFMTNLRVPDSKMPANGQVAGDMISYLAGACIARSTDRGVTFTMASADCVQDSGHFYDGSAVTGTTATGPVYAAFNDGTASPEQIDVWRAATPTSAFTLMANPFPGKDMFGHPRLKAVGTTLYVLAIDTSGRIWATTTTGGAWSTPTLVASDASFRGIHLGCRTETCVGTRIGRNNAPAYDVGPNEQGVPEMRVFYDAYTTAAGVSFLKGVKCTNLTAPTFTCAAIPGWELPKTANSWGATVAVATPIGTPVWKLAWYSDDVGTNVRVSHSNITATGFFGGAAGFLQAACPTTGDGYWGDYDDMKAAGNGTFSITFYRTFTDSSAGACSSSTYNASPQDVSEYALTPF